MSFDVYTKRIKKVISELSKEGLPAALIVTTRGKRYRNRDVEYPFRQDSDIIYLTGCTRADFALCITSRREKPLVVYTPVTSHKKLWEGSGANVSRLARRLNARALPTEEPVKEILKYIRGVSILYVGSDEGSLSRELVQRLLDMPSFARFDLPRILCDKDLLMARLRSYKGREEISNIKESCKIANRALFEAVKFLKGSEGKIYERDLAGLILYVFSRYNAQPAFNPIVAGGRSAAVLHYSDLKRIVRKGEMLLMDIGCEYQSYCSDITRTVPVGGRFEGIQRDLYSLVLEAQRTAISKVRHGVNIKTVYTSAVKILAQGLKDLKILKGSLSSIIERKTYERYSPHSIGHSLGIDVHDVGVLREKGGRLEKGMVITIEPGLYFPEPVGKVPSCGIRIEDDVLVAEKGARVLSEGFPKEIKDLEVLMSS